MTYKELIEAKTGLESLLDMKIEYPKKIELYDLILSITQKLDGFSRERARIDKEYISHFDAYAHEKIYNEGKTEEGRMQELEILLDTEVIRLQKVAVSKEDFPGDTPTLRQMLPLNKIIQFV